MLKFTLNSQPLLFYVKALRPSWFGRIQKTLISFLLTIDFRFDIECCLEWDLNPRPTVYNGFYHCYLVDDEMIWHGHGSQYQVMWKPIAVM